MPLRVVLSCFVAALSLGLSVASAPVTAAGPGSKRIVQVPMLVMYPDNPGYPDGGPGAQGQTVVQLSLDASGAIVDATIVQSSRNRALDKRALQYVRRQGVTVPSGTPLPATVHASVRFARDSDATVVRKTCAEFNLDVAYDALDEQKRAHGPANMRVFWLAMAAYAPVRGISPQLAARMPAAAEATVKTCARTPEANFYEVFTGHLTAVE